MQRSIIALAACLALCLTASLALAQGNKQLMSEKMATQDLKRNLVEAVVGFKVKSSTESGLTEDARYRADTVARSLLKGVVVDKMVYDREKDIALCFGHVDLGQLVNVLGERMDLRDVRVEGFGFGTMTESSRPPLRALRAAQLNAYDQMAALLVGERVFSRSTTENFVLTKDVNRSLVCAAVFGAYVPHPALNDPQRGWGWDENGNAFLKLEMDARKVRDMLGALVVHKTENILEVTGRGAQVDDVTPEQQQQRDGGRANLTRDSGSKTQFMDLVVPGAQPAPQDLSGQSAQ